MSLKSELQSTSATHRPWKYLAVTASPLTGPSLPKYTSMGPLPNRRLKSRSTPGQWTFSSGFSSKCSSRAEKVFCRLESAEEREQLP